ncbi:MAG: hypothetical protein AAGJ82_05750 [Bacteroidota bacterium]
MSSLRHKIVGTGIRLRAIFQFLTQRLRRLGRHVLQFCWARPQWWVELVYLLLDVFGLPEIYETLVDWIKWNTRPLHTEEIALLRPIFGNSIDYRRVRIDERAFLGPPQWHICYVSFYTINAWRPMGPDLLIHEVVHVWQFQQLGSVYIPRALQAQRSAMGYNYGGAPALVNHVRAGGQLTDFNLEQQADIVADYWRLQHGLRPHWPPAGPADFFAYAYLVEEIAEV